MASPLGIIKSLSGGVGGAIELGVETYGAVSTYKDSRKQGSGVATSVGKAALDFAFSQALGPVGMGVIIAKDVVGVGASVAHEYGKINATINNRTRQSNFGGYYRDNQTAYTMRSRGVQALQQSKLTGYSTLGSEARSYFR